MPAAARLARAVGLGRGLDRDAGGVGRDAEGGAPRLIAGGGDDGGAEGGAGVLEPPAHGAAVDADTVARQAVLNAVQGQPVAVLVGRDVGEQRGGRERPWEGLGRSGAVSTTVSPRPSTVPYLTRAMTRRRSPPRFQATLQLSSKPMRVAFPSVTRRSKSSSGSSTRSSSSGRSRRLRRPVGFFLGRGGAGSPVARRRRRRCHPTQPIELAGGWRRTRAPAGACRRARPWRRRSAGGVARAPSAGLRATCATGRARR